LTNHDHRHGTPRYQSPASIRDETFQRRMRGLDAEEVYEYLDLLADQIQATESELSESRAANERLRAELQRMQAGLDEYEQVGDRVNDQVVQLLSQAQLVAEEMVQDVSRDARERIGLARASEQRIVEEAMGAAGEQVRSYARTAQAQLQSIVDSFAAEFDLVGRGSASGVPSSGAADQVDPLFDEMSDWQLRGRNSSGPGTD
jgi:DivIVA domain-containing protein